MCMPWIKIVSVYIVFITEVFSASPRDKKRLSHFEGAFIDKGFNHAESSFQISIKQSGHHLHDKLLLDNNLS